MLFRSRRSQEVAGEWWWPTELSAPGAFDQLEPRVTSALRSAWLAYQPIVFARNSNVFGHEALLRTREGAFSAPPALLDAAGRFGLRPEVGRLVRRMLAGFLTSGVAEDHVVFFMNVIAADLLDPHFLAPAAALSSWASRVILEITDGPELHRVRDLGLRLAALRGLGYRVALEESAAGDGLESLAVVDPDVVRIGRGLVRGIGNSAEQQRKVASTIARASARGCLVVAGLVESAQERAVLVDLGVDLLQGFFFKKPAAWRVVPGRLSA